MNATSVTVDNSLAILRDIISEAHFRPCIGPTHKGYIHHIKDPLKPICCQKCGKKTNDRIIAKIEFSDDSDKVLVYYDMEVVVGMMKKFSKQTGRNVRILPTKENPNCDDYLCFGCAPYIGFYDM